MNTTAARRLRCALCRKGLLQKYNVYDVPDDAPPVLYSTVSGYFYRKGSRHSAGVLEIAGNLGEQSAYTCRMIAFADADGTLGCKTGDLVDISGTGGEIHRITGINDIHGIYYVLDLEVWECGLSY